tara:strand:+ start:1486 stop:2388 length:903 start_codon:yes stop_codon:yes gene_type:complete
MTKIIALFKGIFSKKIITVLVFFILFLFVALLLQRNQMQEELKLKLDFIEQKNILRDDLDDLIDDHDELLDEYGDLNDKLYDKDSIIQNQIAEIRNLIRTKNDLTQARKKIAILKDISKRYLYNIDSLLLLNESLIIEKDSIIKQNKNINWKNYMLNKQNKKLVEKVSKGSVLELLDFNIETIRYRGTGREVSTRFAKKVQKLRMCFTIGNNQISEAEEKIVYMQLVDEDGDLVKGKQEINVNVSDSIFDCTTLSVFNYNNIETTSCFDWERIDQLSSGSYLVNLIIEGRVAGQKKVKLR